jgi:hypothetical protein
MFAELSRQMKKARRKLATQCGDAAQMPERVNDAMFDQPVDDQRGERGAFRVAKPSSWP